MRSGPPSPRIARLAGCRRGIVATIGTTSTTAIDPVDAIADVAAAEGLWLHVDAAYAGSAALIPAMRGYFEGWERADSIVVNPHKWMFTPFDCSLLLTRKMETLRDALSLVPEYLRTYDGKDAGRDYSEYVPQLGRKARGIKMWMQLRYFGLSGPAQPPAAAHRPGAGAGRLDRGRPRCRAALPGALRRPSASACDRRATRAGKGSPRSPRPSTRSTSAS